MRGQYEELSCPFCNKGRIQCWHIPSTTKVRMRSSATFGKITEKIKSSDIWIIQTGCNVCGRSREEVEKELKRQNII